MNRICLLTVLAITVGCVSAHAATQTVVVNPDNSEIAYPVDFFDANSGLIVDAIPWEDVHGIGSTAQRPSCTSTNLGILYVNTDTGTIERCDEGGWQTWFATTGTSHDHDGVYVKKAGDTMSGSLTVSSTNSSHGFTRIVPGGSTAPGYYSFFAPGGERVGHVGWKDNAGNYLQLQTEAGWNWTFTAQPYVGTNPIWHAGNDGAGSGLDADLLDGLSSTNFAAWNHNHDSRYVLLSGGSTIVGAGLTIQGNGLTLKAQASTNPALYVPMWEANPITSGYRLDARHITNLFADMGGHDASRITTGKLSIQRLDISGTPDGTKFLLDTGEWAAVPAGLADAPSDGKFYGRKTNTWVSPTTFTGYGITGGVISNTVTLNDRALLGFMKYKGATVTTTDEHWKIATIQPSGAGQSATLFVRAIGGSVSAANKGVVELMVANRNTEQITYWLRGTKPTQYSIKVYREDDNSLSVYAYLPGAANQFNGFGIDAWMGNWENPASFTSQVYLDPVDVGPSPTGTLVFDATSATPDWHQPHQGTPTVMGNTIWHEGNDGAGSGLDADLLDGLSSSAFALASHNHAAADITSGVIAPARLGSGSATTNTVLYGDGQWKPITNVGPVDYIDFNVGTNVVRLTLVKTGSEYTVHINQQ